MRRFFALPAPFTKRGVLGMNQRNGAGAAAQPAAALSARRRQAAHQTPGARRAGIPTPASLGVITYHHQLREPHAPARRTRAVRVSNRRAAHGATASSSVTSVEERALPQEQRPPAQPRRPSRQHVSNTLVGRLLLRGDVDAVVMIEQRVVLHPAFRQHRPLRHPRRAA